MHIPKFMRGMGKGIMSALQALYNNTESPEVHKVTIRDNGIIDITSIFPIRESQLRRTGKN